MKLDYEQLDEWFELRWGMSPDDLIAAANLRDLTEEELEVVKSYQDFVLKLPGVEGQTTLLISLVMCLDDEVVDCFRSILPTDAASEAKVAVFQKIKELKTACETIGALL